MRLAISVGDINGVGLEIALRSHESIKKICEPIYCINESMLRKGAWLLGLDVPLGFTCKECGDIFEIESGVSTKEAGELSFVSFCTAKELAKSGEVSAIVTLPINKESWERAAVPFVGHTDALGDEAIMMLGCKEMFVILYTHHVPLKDVSKTLTVPKLLEFFLVVENSLHVKSIAVLGLNPHAGDGGVIGDEDVLIQEAINQANKKLGREIFKGPKVPDTAFTTKSRDEFKYFICMYHDQGLIPLKALYFEESINVSLNAGIIRTSVDHGTAFDIAYKSKNPSCVSYVNAVKEAVKLSLNQN